MAKVGAFSYLTFESPVTYVVLALFDLFFLASWPMHWVRVDYVDEQGEPRRAVWGERRASGLAGRCEGARTPSLAIAAPVRAALTHRELETARLAAEGLANKEIADRLYLSHRTVENQLHAVYEKLGVEGRAALAQALKGAPGPPSVR